jgi:hypothetical protein
VTTNQNSQVFQLTVYLRPSVRLVCPNTIKASYPSCFLSWLITKGLCGIIGNSRRTKHQMLHKIKRLSPLMEWDQSYETFRRLLSIARHLNNRLKVLIRLSPGSLPLILQRIFVHQFLLLLSFVIFRTFWIRPYVPNKYKAIQNVPTMTTEI